MKVMVGLTDYRGQAWWRQIAPYSRLGNAHEVVFSHDGNRPFYRQFDAVSLGRVSTDAGLNILRECKEDGITTIMDIDDNLHDMARDNPAFPVYSNGKQATKLFEEALPLADYVTCSTENLANHYAKYRGKNDFILLENFIPDDVVNILRPDLITGMPKREGQIRIGYTGSSSHGQDIPILAKPFRRIMEKYPQVQIVVFGIAPTMWPLALRSKTEHYPYIDPKEGEVKYEFMGRYFQQLKDLELDIACIPLQPTLFNQGKSFLKILEYAGLCVPVVASNVGPYRVLRDRRKAARFQGFYCVDNESKSWEWALEALIGSFEARREMARANYEHLCISHMTGPGTKPLLELLATIEQGRCRTPA